MQRTSGIVLLAGSLLALAAIIPLTMTGPVFVAENEAEQAEINEEGETEWDVSSFLLGFGGIVTAIGLGLFGSHLRETDTDVVLKLPAYLAVGIAVIGAVPGTG